MKCIELITDHFMVCMGDFSDTIDYSNGTKVTGLVTESEPGLFQFAFMVHNFGIGIAICSKCGRPFVD